MAFKILITEGESPLALSLLKVFENKGYTVICPKLALQDWSDEQKVRSLFDEVQPAIFVNTLQLFSPTHSLDDPSCYEIASAVSAKLYVKSIHISSHQVFPSGLRGKAFTEEDPPEPDTPIGQMYLFAEQAYLSNPKCVVLRLPWLLSGENGYLDQFLTALVYSAGVQVCESSRGCFVSFSEVARIVAAMAQQMLCDSNNWGIVHMRSSDSSSELEFVDYLQRLLKKIGCQTSPINIVSYEYRFIQTNGWLTGTRCANGFGIQFRSWRHAIKTKVDAWTKKEEQKGLVLGVPEDRSGGI